MGQPQSIPLPDKDIIVQQLQGISREDVRDFVYFNINGE